MPPLAHSRLSPSSAKQWATCTASIGFIEANAKRIPPDRGSVYAQIGTQAHDYAEKLLKGKMKTKSLPGEFSPVLEYTSRCENLINRWNGTTFVEERVELFYLPEEKGTVDFALLCDDGLWIRDLKYGEGVPVAAEENYQLAIYAQSLIESFDGLYSTPDDLPVDIGIISPRYVGEDIEKVWLTTVGGLREFTSTHIKPAAELILSGSKEVEFRPSLEACRWCKAKDICPSRYREALAPIGYDEFIVESVEQEITFPDVKTISDENLLKIFLNADKIKNVLSTVGGEVTRRALSGDPVPGTKLVEGRQGNTEWVMGAEEWVQKWVAEPYEKKLISPTKAFAEMKATHSKEEIESIKRDYTRRSPGKPVVAPESDKRPAITASIDQFTTIDEEDSIE